MSNSRQQSTIEVHAQQRAHSPRVGSAFELPTHPLWDQDLDEPYLPLPSYPELRLTPNHVGDDADVAALLNEPEVARYAFIRPADYKLEHTAIIWTELQPKIQQTIDAIRPAIQPWGKNAVDCAEQRHASPVQPSATVLPIPYYPFPVIRHHSTGRIVGDLGMRQSRIKREIGDKVVSPVATGSGDGTHVGVASEELVWELGYNLMPEYRGQGLMSEALNVAIEGWCKWIGIRSLIAETVNRASAAVLASRGFVKTKTYMQDWPEYNGGGQREMNRWELSL